MQQAFQIVLLDIFSELFPIFSSLCTRVSQFSQISSQKGMMHQWFLEHLKVKSFVYAVVEGG